MNHAWNKVYSDSDLLGNDLAMAEEGSREGKEWARMKYAD